MQMMEVVRASVTGILLDGKIGTPRQAGTWWPPMSTLSGTSPRRLHSRPKAAIAFGWARKSFDPRRRESSSSMSSGLGTPSCGWIRCP